ncbi:hypothetical protein [Acidithiobacillus concretivorus]|uniref:Uncharacterized protein n=1 Tax=Acidithiobacillus concretivorus TaxID=3063952 RepID=A0ABS5ZLD1_9PROT|nr:hypothetical protein [Acidithiobacillus concretivorus]MBU2737422.1 hypothetical protein [Acidithiobacillus concretivorus]
MLKALWTRIKNLNKLFIWIVLVPTGLSILYFGSIVDSATGSAASTTSSSSSLLGGLLGSNGLLGDL